MRLSSKCILVNENTTFSVSICLDFVFQCWYQFSSMGYIEEIDPLMTNFEHYSLYYNTVIEYTIYFIEAEVMICDYATKQARQTSETPLYN